ncbi:hypothetical protein PAPYR_8317 [Paratrimastix pyriformis]|uniref:Uncharacterized protein n=1 Tax=Paratrimastix pyriformis TaxID=342808 RepID=A0ABQ8UGH5_9EUKA|nr:hypothetical protein PAPYR_8317 [Paratrimastix pyriformis]
MMSVLEARLGLKTTIKTRRLSSYNLNKSSSALQKLPKEEAIQKLEELKQKYAQNQRHHDTKELRKQLKLAKAFEIQKISKKLKGLTAPSPRFAELTGLLAFVKKLDLDLLLDRTRLLFGLDFLPAQSTSPPVEANFTAEQEQCIQAIVTMSKVDQMVQKLKQKRYGVAILPHARKQQAQKATMINQFAGKKIKFADDDDE